MVKSIEFLQKKVSAPLRKSFGPYARVLTVEAHGDVVKGLALCPGKVVRYVLEARASRLKTCDLLVMTKPSNARSKSAKENKNNII